MTSIDKTSLIAQHDAASEPGPEGSNHFDKLPPELVQAIVDQIVDEPHALAGFAATSYRTLLHTNQGLQGLVPPALRANSNILGAWTAQFRTLAPDIQKALKATAGLLPPPDIFAPIDTDTQAVYANLAEARKYAYKKGPASSMELHLGRARDYANKLGIAAPDTRGIEREGYTKAIDIQLAGARNFTGKGFASEMEMLLGRVRRYANKAGIAAPDTEIEEIQQILTQASRRR